MTSLLAARSTGRGMRLVDSAEELHHHGTVAAKPRVMARAACSRRSRHLVQASDAEGRDPANSVPLEASACAPATTAVDDSPAAAGQHPSGDAAGAAAAQRWDTLTQQLVALSTLPFIFLFLPQLLKNHANLTAGNAEALAVLSWMGFLTGLGGNSLLLSYFAAKREMNAVVVQATGIASSFAVLTQIRVAGLMPRAAYAALALVVGLQAILTGLKLAGRLDRSKAGQRLWSVWLKLLALAGLAGVPQVLWATFRPASPTLAPSLLTLAGGCAALVLEAAGRMPPRMQGLWAAASAWTATALFMMQPVSQLVNNFTDPASLEGLSLATILLASGGNALMVPRALFTRDLVWLAGTLWGSLVFGWAQLLSMCLGRSPATGARFLPLPAFLTCTLLLGGWLGGAAALSARAGRQRQLGGGTAAAAEAKRD